MYGGLKEVGTMKELTTRPELKEYSKAFAHGQISSMVQTLVNSTIPQSGLTEIQKTMLNEAASILRDICKELQK